MSSAGVSGETFPQHAGGVPAGLGALRGLVQISTTQAQASQPTLGRQAEAFQTQSRVWRILGVNSKANQKKESTSHTPRQRLSRWGRLEKVLGTMRDRQGSLPSGTCGFQGSL